VATPAPTSTSAYAQAVLNDAPAGYWRLDETSPGTVADSSGHGLNGQTNGSIILGRPGPTQDNTTSMQFDGKTGYVSLGDPTALQPNAVSVEAWINANAGPGMIVRKRFDGYALSLNPSGQPVFEMNDANAIDYRVTGPTSIANGAWHHVVGTYDGQKVCLYVDGQPAGSCQPAGAIHYAADLVAIGRDGGASDDYFGGRIKDVAIYAKALSPQQVAAHLAAAAAAVNP